MYYVRKLSKNINLYKIQRAQTHEMIESDILKQELSTKENTLSFWKCDSLNQVTDTIKAILLSTTAIETTQFIVIDDAQIKEYAIETDDTQPGKTGYAGFEHLHINFCNLTYQKIGQLLKMYKESVLKVGYTPKLQKADVKKYISEVKQAGLINEENTNPDLMKDILKYCS